MQNEQVNSFFEPRFEGPWSAYANLNTDLCRITLIWIPISCIKMNSQLMATIWNKLQGMHCMKVTHDMQLLMRIWIKHLTQVSKASMLHCRPQMNTKDEYFMDAHLTKSPEGQLVIQRGKSNNFKCFSRKFSHAYPLTITISYFIYKFPLTLEGWY